MNKFNLTFWGEILPGRDPAEVKTRFAKLFDIKDPERLEHFFSGETITLRRNIERKVAAEYFAKLHKLGVEAELVKVDPTRNPPDTHRSPVQAAPEPEDEDQHSPWEKARRQAEREVIQRAKQDAEARKRAALEREKQEQQRAEEERLFREQQAELERERLAAQALREAEKERERREREAEAARLRAEQEERRRLKSEEEEQQRRLREEERQRKAEEAARLRAEQEERRRLRAEEEERQRRLREEERERKAEEAARLRAEQEERRRLKAEEEERQKRLREEDRLRKAEEAARKKAEAAAEAELRRAEELARLQEEQERQQRLREEEAKRREAEEAERQRLREEREARLQEEREKRRRKKAEAAARRKAEARAVAQQRRREQEQRRREREEALERQRAEREAARKAAEAEAARRREEKEALERQRAEEAARERARREAERRKKADEATRRKAELAAAREEAERELARKKAEAQERKRLREEAARREAALRAEEKQQVAKQAAREREAERARLEADKQAEIAREKARAEERKRMEEQALARGAAALASQSSLKRSPARVKSGMELPRREKPGKSSARRRQPGAPNDYQTRPFRNTSEVRDRPALAAQKLRQGLGLATLVLALALLLVGRYLSLPPVTVYAGPDRITAAPGGQLLIQAGDKLLLHDRAGIGTLTVQAGQLELEQPAGPLVFAGDGQLLLRAASAGDTTLYLQRCDLASLGCDTLNDIQFSDNSALVVHSLTGQLFLADPGAGSVTKLSGDGQVAASAQLPVAPRPALVLNSGLLFMNSHEGPAISVRRYEDQAFGQQLDEVLLLPPAALEAGQIQVHDFLAAADRWWVSMINPETGSAGLYLFDSQWKYLSDVALPESHLPAQLVPWGQKVLVSRSTTSRILRFDGSGTPEVDLESDLLTGLIQSQERRRFWVAIGWGVAFSLCLVIVALTLSFTYIQYLRNLVYRGRTTRGAEPLDQFSDQLRWAAPEQARGKRLRRTAITYGLLGIAILLLLAGMGATTSLLVAALLALTGPAAGLYLYSRGGTGHAGVAGDTLALVDHRDIYHLATGARIQYRGPFLLIDDIVVFTGTSLLPAMEPAQVQELLQPVAEGGARIDRKTVLVKLLEGRHPLALAALVCALCLLAGTVALLAGAF